MSETPFGFKGDLQTDEKIPVLCQNSSGRPEGCFHELMQRGHRVVGVLDVVEPSA
jgi:hypothetical protein